MRGLTGAFLIAGSRAVVCSLWRVEDEETAQFMRESYAAVNDGAALAAALRQVRRAAIAAGKPPLHWAAFILVGG